MTILNSFCLDDHIDFFVRDTDEVLLMHYGSIWVQFGIVFWDSLKNFLQYRLLVIVQNTSSVLYMLYFIVA